MTHQVDFDAAMVLALQTHLERGVLGRLAKLGHRTLARLIHEQVQGRQSRQFLRRIARDALERLIGGNHPQAAGLEQHLGL